MTEAIRGEPETHWDYGDAIFAANMGERRVGVYRNRWSLYRFRVVFTPPDDEGMATECLYFTRRSAMRAAQSWVGMATYVNFFLRARVTKGLR